MPPKTDTQSELGLCLKTQFLPLRKHTETELQRQIVYVVQEIICVYSENRTKQLKYFVWAVHSALP